MTKFLILLLLVSAFCITAGLINCQQPQISVPTPQQSGDEITEQLPQISIPTPQQSGDTVQQPSFKVFGSHHIIRPIISHFKPHHSHNILPHLRGSPHPSHSHT